MVKIDKVCAIFSMLVTIDEKIQTLYNKIRKNAKKNERVME